MVWCLKPLMPMENQFFNAPNFSIGGGFVMSADELIATADEVPLAEVPHGFKTAVEMLAMSDEGNISVAGMKMANEATVMSESEVRAGLDRI